MFGYLQTWLAHTLRNVLAIRTILSKTFSFKIVSCDRSYLIALCSYRYISWMQDACHAQLHHTLLVSPSIIVSYPSPNVSLQWHRQWICSLVVRTKWRLPKEGRHTLGVELCGPNLIPITHMCWWFPVYSDHSFAEFQDLWRITFSTVQSRESKVGHTCMAAPIHKLSSKLKVPLHHVFRDPQQHSLASW